LLLLSILLIIIWLLGAGLVSNERRAVMLAPVLSVALVTLQASQIPDDNMNIDIKLNGLEQNAENLQHDEDGQDLETDDEEDVYGSMRQQNSDGAMEGLNLAPTRTSCRTSARSDAQATTASETSASFTNEGTRALKMEARPSRQSARLTRQATSQSDKLAEEQESQEVRKHQRFQRCLWMCHPAGFDEHFFDHSLDEMRQIVSKNWEALCKMKGEIQSLRRLVVDNSFKSQLQSGFIRSGSDWVSPDDFGTSTEAVPGFMKGTHSFGASPTNTYQLIANLKVDSSTGLRTSRYHPRQSGEVSRKSGRGSPRRGSSM
jgi:hypothetical protein